MDKRIIDADALLEELGLQRGISPLSCEKLYAYETQKIINRLSMPAPVAQESIFDADGWCWDMDLIPKDCERILLACEYGISVGWRLTDGYIESEFTELHRGYPADWKAWQPLPTIPTRGDL